MFALVDGNNFFASCEQVFRPDLWNKPVIVLSSNDGCVVSRSAEARALGIKMGVPLFQLGTLPQRLGITVFSSNFELYSDLSRRMMATIASLAPRIEVYSVDEAFVDLDGIDDASGCARAIRRRVWRWTGLPSCVGIAPTKTLAKFANHLAKRHPSYGGVCNWEALSEIDRRHALTREPTAEIWGIGRRLSKQLAEAGILTAHDLQQANPAFIRKRHGVTVERIVHELNGRSCLCLEAIGDGQQQILRSRSFGQPITGKADLQAAIAHHIGNAAVALRRLHCEAALVGIHIGTHGFGDQKHHYYGWDNTALPTPSADTLALTRAAMALLTRIYRSGFAYRKAGVVLSGLSRTRQPDLFSPGDTAQRQTLMHTLDAINRRYGNHTLSSAAELGNTRWQARKTRRSPRYTTCWAELPVVG